MHHSSSSRLGWRRAAALVVSAVLAATALAAVPAGPAQAQPTTSCVDVEYEVVSMWPTGPESGAFVAYVALTNNCETTVPDWIVELTLPPGHTVTQGWNAIIQIFPPDKAVFTCSGWNCVIVPGGSTMFGFIGTFVGEYQDPLACTFNGVTCGGWAGGDNQPPEVTLTSPTNGAGLIYPCPIRLAADAVDPDGAIDRVEFYVNDVLVGTAETAPYRVEFPSSQVGQLPAVVVARAYDDGDPQLSTDSAPVSFNLFPPPPALWIIACSGGLVLEEGGSDVVTLLNACGGTPEVEMVVTGDSGITVTPASFTLGPGGQQVTISAELGSAGAAATVVATAEACPQTPGRISVTVTG